MDTNARLEKIRELTSELHDSDGGDPDVTASTGRELAEHVKALDESLLNGGHLPDVWKDGCSDIIVGKLSPLNEFNNWIHKHQAAIVTLGNYVSFTATFSAREDKRLHVEYQTAMSSDVRHTSVSLEEEEDTDARVEVRGHREEHI
jgi:hypothetical protein